MNTNLNKTKVLFLLEGDNNDQVYAYFPEISADYHGNKQAYAHIGQHSACQPSYANASPEATPKQYADLKAELEGYGYDLEVINSNTAQPSKEVVIIQDEDEEPTEEEIVQFEDIDNGVDFTDYTNSSDEDSEVVIHN